MGRGSCCPVPGNGMSGLPHQDSKTCVGEADLLDFYRRRLLPGFASIEGPKYPKSPLPRP
jgi:hypothetical protein